MELVYLWVEEYKNIHKQGFNFSPRFECTFYDEYDENGFLEDNCKIKIKENDNYIENFFGENINVTAIVGKNGSGKSTVLELLIKIANKYTLLNTTCFFVYRKLEKWYIVGKIMPTCNYDLEDSFFNDNESINWINYLYSRNDTLLKKYIERQSMFNEYGGNYIWKHTQVYNRFSNILSSLEKKYKFNTFLLKIKLVNKKIIEEKDFDNNTILKSDTIKFCEKIISSFYSKKQRLSVNSIKNLTIESLLSHNAFLLFVTFYIMNKDNLELTEDNFVICLQALENNNINFIFEKLDEFNKSLNEDNDFEIYFQQLKFLKQNIDKFVFDGNEFYIWEVPLSEKDTISKIIDNTKVISGIFDPATFYYLIESVYYDFSNNETNIFYNDLSEGEKEIFKISIDFLHHLDFNSNDSIFIFDEIDNSLHPIWKKEIFKILMNLFNQFKKKHNNKNIHLILTTHSPFLLSDIPKENIIFLKDGKNDKGINHKQTFGANIHTLLSDSFFMEDGLMGEFAKGKINEIIDFHKEVEEANSEKEALKIKYLENQKKFWQTQSIVGESYLKQILENHLIEIEKILLGKDEAKESKKERLLAQLKELDND